MRQGVQDEVEHHPGSGGEGRNIPAENPGIEGPAVEVAKEAAGFGARGLGEKACKTAFRLGDPGTFQRRALLAAGDTHAQGLDLPESGKEELHLGLEHVLGHHLGLQVHDVGGNLADELGTPLRQPEAYPFLRNLRTVEAGNVLTVEPGLYFIPQLLEALRARSCGRRVNWKAVDALRECGGVRIEDDVLCTKSGREVLSAAVPKERAALEALVGSAVA